MPSAQPLDILADELGAAAGRIEREIRLQFEALEARVDARLASIALAAVEAENERQRKFESRLAELKDGKDGRDGIDGKDADVEPLLEAVMEQGRHLSDVLTRKVDERLSVVRDGKDGEPGPAGEPGPPGKDGLMPIAREWMAGVHQAGAVVVRNGSTYQAIRETDDEPPASDWIPLAVRGDKGFGFTLRGTWKAEETYSLNDVVVVDRGSFGALRDNPGPCPGEGWQLLAGAGGRGKEGPPGPRGEKGMDGKSLAIVKLEADPDSMLLRIVDGSGKVHDLDLEPIAQQILEAAR